MKIEVTESEEKGKWALCVNGFEIGSSKLQCDALLIAKFLIREIEREYTGTGNDSASRSEHEAYGHGV